MALTKTKIDWPNLDYTWNPLLGCRGGCNYCYAKRMNDRFKWIADWQKPVFFKERLLDPFKVKKPSTIFVGSMTDVFGQWVPKEWIDVIIHTAKMLPQHTFMFLTKNPQRYLEFEFSDNCWLGTTITGENHKIDLWRLMMLFQKKNNKRFISIEPLLGTINHGKILDNFNLIIVGAMTGPNAISPKKEWIQSIKHHNVYYKNNIKKYVDRS